MFLVHKKGFVAGKKMVDGLVPYDFFCEDSPAINLFVFTGSAAKGKAVEEQTLWGFTRLERFEALSATLVANKKTRQGWFQSVNVLTGPAQNGTQSVKFQRVLKIIKHVSVLNRIAKTGYEILTDEGDTYFTLKPALDNNAQTVIYAAQ